MELSPQDRERLIADAKAVLDGNRAGDSTKPSPDLYPHQWMWDSCFIAIGVSRYDPERAQNELRALLRGQWSNGMVPQIIFNPDSSGYFPGPETWQSSLSPHAPKNVETSGITQPPVLATAALAVAENDPDGDRARRFVCEVYQQILEFHEFLYRERNPDCSDLIVVLHPWESGLDNSPPYLEAGSRVELTYQPTYTRLDTKHVAAANRPSDKDYDLFVWLLEQMRSYGYDWRSYLPSAQLQVEDVLFNSILVKAGQDLSLLCEWAGADEESSRAIELGGRTDRAMSRLLWDEGAKMFFSRDRVTGRLIKEESISSLMPLYAGALYAGGPSGPLEAQSFPNQRPSMVRTLEDPSRFWPSPGYACPSTAITSRMFDAENYWLGPVWVNTNWLLINGLELTKNDREQAKRLRRDTLTLVKNSGFREYFNPFTGEGYGTDRFSWSAALTIDLLSDESAG